MLFLFFTVVLLLGIVNGLRYDPQYDQYNLNQNNTDDPLEYWGKWENHNFQTSPDNWRFPFYTLFLDRFVDGDPTNDNINGTHFEQDVTGTQLRFGGDIAGLVDTLDYIRGMGVRGLYIAGSPFINQPWGADQYSPLDHTLLDMHFGNISQWRTAIEEIHKRGMYIILDNTVATMGDLIGFDNYLNVSTPFWPKEHPALWKTSRRYTDFSFGTTYNETCDFPRFYLDTGEEVGQDVYDMFHGCYDGDFDQFGDTEAFGVYPDYRRQITKFASVQDRLREWIPSVRQKLAHFSCITIAMLDIDGFRYDKATQATVDAEGEFSASIRQCARALQKENFFLPGEITGGNAFGALYVGRGRQPNQYLTDIQVAANLTNATTKDIFIRDDGQQALDSAAFHYSIYRYMLRFLGMDGDVEAAFDLPKNWVEAWNEMLLTNDFLNANTGKFDPRHMYGVVNQDVFRWPAITFGVDRDLLGLFITTLYLPGIPLLLWGEEQAFYILDNTASNYMYGRQPIASAPAWQEHGCYSLNATLYYHMPLEAALYGCEDDTVSWDHRDPTHPVRNILKHMYQLREDFPVLKDGFYLQQLSAQTKNIQYPGSSGIPTETGIWSIMRSGFYSGIQNLTDETPIWFLYHNWNATTTYTFDCSSTNDSEVLISPFDTGTKVKNLIFPHQEMTLVDSSTKLHINGSTKYNGCYNSITLDPYEFRVYVPEQHFVPPPPMLTKFYPGHDYRIKSADTTSVSIEFQTSVIMDCDKFTDSISFNSNTLAGTVPKIETSTVTCKNISQIVSNYTGSISSAWSWTANITNVEPGIHQIVVTNATTADHGSFTDSTDRFLLRVGDLDNPIVFPATANYSSNLLSKTGDDSIKLAHSAPGATKFRYSTNWESSWSDWMSYPSDQESTVPILQWNGTDAQSWKGYHVIVQYFSQLLGSSSFVQHSDMNFDSPRRLPHLWAEGPFNQYGYDAGLDNEVKLVPSTSTRQWHYMDEWPARIQMNVWGINPDKEPDQTFVYGDIDNDTVLDRLPPSSLIENDINITAPARPYLAYHIFIEDSTLRYQLIPQGNMWFQLLLWLLLWIVPVVSGIIVVQGFKRSFYKVKFNESGVHPPSRFELLIRKLRNKFIGVGGATPLAEAIANDRGLTAVGRPIRKRRRVLIATMEYNIDDWGIKVKIGGLGVMAQLMSQVLKHEDLVWVVPCVGGVEYPLEEAEPGEPVLVKIIDQYYEIMVYYHRLENITFVLLDAPVFRRQSKAEPYPARMDDLDSAIYYSAWNQCIAETLNRFPVDLYHINDYHGAAALLYLLPRTIPACLSLHNAEFQGMWPMRTPDESQEVCKVFNLPPEIVREYIQFGTVFNLLNAGASYLRIHQQGFGAVGVSRKYGDRSFARYPIFWGLSKVGRLPNPDPSDTAEWNEDEVLKNTKIQVDRNFEAGRVELRRQAQEWAGLRQDPEADLFVFVGRWSLQKGVDLIADIFPWVLAHYPHTQLICVGPIIDLYGRFAAIKLEKLVQQYPGRVFSRPEFTQLPPYIFGGAEFTLIPSRDEPFGLVAVEFGRKGALGVGARVGGLGTMPGWWYTVESTKASHLLTQFKHAIVAALETDHDTRARMRAWSAKQRFPVAQWLEKLEKLQTTAIKIHAKAKKRASKRTSTLMKHATGSRSTNIVAWDNDVELTPLPPSPPSVTIGRRIPDFDDDTTLGDPSRPISDYSVVPDFYSTGQSGYSTPAGYVTPTGLSRPDTPGLGSTPGLGTPGSGTPGAGFDTPGSASSGPPTVGLGAHSREDSDASISGLDSILNFGGVPPLTLENFHYDSARSSQLSLEDVVGGRRDFNLQKVDPFFTDSTGEYSDAFKKKLERLSEDNSASDLCIEEYLIKSEKEWFNKYRNLKIGRSSSPSSSLGHHRNHSKPEVRYSKLQKPMKIHGHERKRSPLVNSSGFGGEERLSDPPDYAQYKEQFGIPDDYIPPKGLKRYLQYQIGEWPIYSMLLALNQIIASSSYQITLLTGEVGQTATKLYAIASVYLAFAVIWFIMARTVKLLYPLSIPFVFYGAAFLVLGCSPFASTSDIKGWLQRVATGLYAAASSSGSMAFAFNFGTDGGSTVNTWIFRLAMIQGLNQLYTLGLWAWGSVISAASAANTAAPSLANSPLLLAVCLPIALLLWAVGLILFIGLPDYYREAPGPMPQLWKTLLKRRTIAWYLLAMVIQNYFLSTLYGRNWFFLFSSQAVSKGFIVLLALCFFIGAWCLVLWILVKASGSHPWLFSMFSVGLGAPRWAQQFWGTSRIGYWLPWAEKAVASAILSRMLWLWLGLLDGIQSAGIGMILMLTLTRVHVAAACTAASVLGSLATIAARATAPNKLGPGSVFPDISQGLGALATPWFWIVMALQLGICVGYAKFFRKEQVSKP